MTRLRLLPAARLAAILCLAGRAWAGDSYVDAVHGSDANFGDNPFSAWRTITWAVSHAPGNQQQVIHIAAGTYDTALGEIFPIEVQPGQRLYGAARDQVILDAGGATSAVLYFNADWVGDLFGPLSGLENLTLRNASSGILLEWFTGVLAPTMRNLLIEDVAVAGIDLVSVTYVSATPIFERVVVQRAGVGMTSETKGVIVRARDCHFVDSVGSGCRIDLQGTFEFDRCRFDGNGQSGVALLGTDSYPQSVTLRDCSIARNGAAGVEIQSPPNGFAPRDVEFERCTVAGNAGAGLDIALSPASVDITVRDSIFVNAAGDVAIAAPAINVQAIAVNSMFADGFSAGVNGCFSADPLFRNAAVGDYRLSWGSPCIDRSPGVPQGDVLGIPRNIDGDLDTVEMADLGAYESLRLDTRYRVEQGSLLSLEVTGPPGALCKMKWSRFGLLYPPHNTNYGQLDLIGSSVFSVTTLGPNPSHVTRSIPISPLIVGHEFYFQALVDSGDSPTGKAYTNPVYVMIVP